MNLTPELLAAILAYDVEAEKRRCREEGWHYSCVACGGEYVVEIGLDPAPLCHGCTHEFAEEAAQFLDELRIAVKGEHRYIDGQGATVAERAYRVGWNDAVKHVERILEALSTRPL